jgi:hypothetical protein
LPVSGLTLSFFGFTMSALPVWSSGRPGKSWARKASEPLDLAPRREGDENSRQSLPATLRTALPTMLARSVPRSDAGGRKDAKENRIATQGTRY